MSTKDEVQNSAKENPGRRVNDKDVKQAGRVDQASKTITQPAQEIADDEVIIAETGSKP
jgi:hypothetical protein